MLLIPVLQKLRRDYLLHFLLLLAVALSFFVPFVPWRVWQALDGQTLVILAGLLLLTKGIELSGYLDSLGLKLVRRLRSERRLALFMVLSAAVLSTFLTNDVALFICVPMALSLKKYRQIAVNRLIIFQALAVNAGSLLTPLGNPQNILLWQRSGLSFFAFIGQMAPLALALMLSLLLLCWCCFSPIPIRLSGLPDVPWRRRLLWLCLALYLLFLLALNLHYPVAGLMVLLAGFGLLARRIFTQVDWSLLLVFALMFVDVHLISQLPALQKNLVMLAQQAPFNQFLLALGLSQLISNVPASMLLLNVLPASPPLSWAVNIGGFGLLQGSLANIIALRMAQSRRIYWQFHGYSVPMLFWSALLGYVLLTG